MGALLVAAQLGFVGVASAPADVPSLTATQAVIRVPAGADRTRQDVTPLPGVVLGLFATQTATDPVGGFGTCTSDQAGDCSFVVPDTQVGGANRDRRFWVRQISAPTGWLANPALLIGSIVSPPIRPSTYQFQTPLQLRGGKIYTAGAPADANQRFMTDLGPSLPTSSSGIWQDSRTEPTPNASCDVHVALALDVANRDLDAVKRAADATVRALGSMRYLTASVSLYPFAGAAPPVGAPDRLNLPIHSTSDVQSVQRIIDALGQGTGGSNWDAVLEHIAAATQHYDLAGVITGIGPTAAFTPPQGSSTVLRFVNTEFATFAANALKAEGTWIGADTVQGVRPGSVEANLVAISGPVPHQDWFSEGSQGRSFQDVLSTLADIPCRQAVTIAKRVIPAGGSIADAVPGLGYDFNVAAPNLANINPTRGVTGLDGTATFTPAVAPRTTVSATFVETLRAGHPLVPINGANATCVRADTGTTVPTTNSGTLGFSLALDGVSPVTCTVYDQAPPATASVTVNKTWVVNGVALPNGQQPPGLVATAMINGTAQPWSQPRTGFAPNDAVLLDETTDVSGAPLCTLSGSRLTSANGTPDNRPLPIGVFLTANGANTFGITNTVTCGSELTLAKDVANGSAPPTAWTLQATGPVGSLPGPAGVTGSAQATAAVTPGAVYALAEAGGDPTYAQDDHRTRPVPGSTGSWTCAALAAGGTVLPGFADGADGGVTVPAGYHVRCTATNRTAQLTLAKQVVNAHGGTAAAGAWILTATPVDPAAPAPPSVVVRGDAGTAAQVRPDQVYRLSEAGPPGYTAAPWQCATSAGTVTTGDTITLDGGARATCTIVNTDEPARLTLRKVVDPGSSGSTKTPADWTLTASPDGIPGQAPVSGNGADGVTDQAVSAGSYTLGEQGPAGFTAGTWTCTGGALDGTTLTLALDDAATCTITNVARAPTLTLVKHVANGTTGGTARPTDWTLTATGPTTISGRSGSGQVTAVAAPIGTYALAESGGPTGYTASGWTCTGAASSTDNTVTLAEGDAATCAITNSADAATLTLIKRVVAASGNPESPTAWTLRADGPTSITGVTGSAAVTHVAVPIGHYVLSESGPPGYTASTWSCSAAIVSDATVSIDLGADVTCTLTNTEQGPTTPTAPPSHTTSPPPTNPTSPPSGPTSPRSTEPPPPTVPTPPDAGGPLAFTGARPLTWLVLGGALLGFGMWLALVGRSRRPHPRRRW